MFFKAEDAAAFAKSPEIASTMDHVRTFLFDHGLLGSGAVSPDVVGIELADGKILGDAGNVKFRFTDAFMADAAAGKALTAMRTAGEQAPPPHTLPRFAGEGVAGACLRRRCQVHAALSPCG